MPGLVGMKEICNYLRRSEATVLNMIRDMDLPARKVLGVWESDTGLIDEWRVKTLSGGNGQAPSPTRNGRSRA